MIKNINQASSVKRQTIINPKPIVNEKLKIFCAALMLIYTGDVIAAGGVFSSSYSGNKGKTVAEINASSSYRGSKEKTNESSRKSLSRSASFSKSPNNLQRRNSFERKTYKISEEEYKNLLNKLSRNDTSSIKDLINKGVDFSQAKYHGYEALYCAIFFENKDLIKMLVKHGVDINYKMQLFSTPLMRAILDQKQNMIECLVECGANVNLDDGYDTPLTQIAGGFYPVLNQQDAIKYLVNHGADINKPDKSGKTPLMVAIEYFDVKVVKCLIDLGADVNKADNEGNTPLSITTGRKFQQNLHQYLSDVMTSESKVRRQNQEIREYLKAHGAIGDNSTEEEQPNLELASDSDSDF